LLLILVPVLFSAAFTGLQLSFDYPAILRLPAPDVLVRFANGGPMLSGLWYAMMVSALAFIPAAIGVGVLYGKSQPFPAGLCAAFGLVAGLVQAMGLLRWVILVPGLAASYLDPGSTDIERQIATSLFGAANTYFGTGVGEHFGYLFTALWTATVALLVWRQWRWLAILGLAVAAGVAAGMLEPFGLPVAGTINAISFSLWTIWVLIFGVAILRARPVGVAPLVPAAAQA
jgi:hypothetical protein